MLGGIFTSSPPLLAPIFLGLALHGRGVRVLELQLAARGKPSARECSATYWGEEKAPRLASILAESRPEDAPANPAPPQKRILVIAITSRIQRPR